MTGERAVVAVHAVAADGGTGAPVGRATLVEADVALADPPLAARLGQQPGARLRVGIAPAGDAGVEVIDVAAHVLPDAPELVVLELARESQAPVSGMPLALDDDDPVAVAAALLDPSREQVLAGLRAVLAAAPPPPPFEFPPGTIDDPIRMVLRALGLRP